MRGGYVVAGEERLKEKTQIIRIIKIIKSGVLLA